MPLDRSAILAVAPSLPREELTIPEWGGSVFVRCMNGTERDRFESLVIDGKRANFRALLAAFSVCDESGSLLFGEKDVPSLAAQPSTALERILVASLRLSKFSEGDVQELAKNSGRGPSGDSA